MKNSSKFIQFAVEQGVLQFGEFTLKSGRVSPYFFNAGLFNDGAALDRLSSFYARLSSIQKLNSICYLVQHTRESHSLQRWR